MRSPDRDDAQGPVQPVLTPIEVDVDGLRDFRDFLVRELDTNLRPGVDAIRNDHAMGARFGIGHAGAQVQAARLHYADVLRAAAENLAQYVVAAEILIEAIRIVTINYTEADLIAAANSTKVYDDLTNALAEQISGRAHDTEREAAHETLRELHRAHAGATS
jgi:hypothetical protein